MKAFTGEVLGTFLLVLFGCGSAAVSVLFGEYQSILQIGMVWGIAVMLAVYLVAPIVGGVLAALFFVHILEPQLKKKSNDCTCSKNDQP